MYERHRQPDDSLLDIELTPKQMIALDTDEWRRRMKRLGISKKRADELKELRRKIKNRIAASKTRNIKDRRRMKILEDEKKIVSSNGGYLNNMSLPELNKYLFNSGLNKIKCDAIKRERRKCLNRRN